MCGRKDGDFRSCFVHSVRSKHIMFGCSTDEEYTSLFCWDSGDDAVTGRNHPGGGTDFPLELRWGAIGERFFGFL